MDMEQVLAWLLVTAVVAVLFGLTIFVHEFGHFIAARWCGLVVDAFSIGFGDSGLTFDLRVWTNRFERSDAIRSELAEAVSAALTAAKIGHTTVGGTTGG